MKRSNLIILITLLLCAYTHVSAQLKVTATGTNGTCAADCFVQAKTTGGVEPINFELRTNAGVVVKPSQQDSLFDNVSPGSYIIWAYDRVSGTTPIKSSQVTVTTSYRTLVLSNVQGSIQSNLAYSCTANPNAGNIWNYWAGTGKGPYTLSVTSGPTIPAPTPVNAGVSSAYINGLSTGNYVVSIKDACNAEVSSGTVAVQGSGNIIGPATVSSAFYGKSSLTGCNKGTDITVSLPNGYGYGTRLYGEFFAGSGNFTDTVTVAQGVPAVLKFQFASTLTPSQLTGKQWNVWVQQPCTRVWQRSTLTIDNLGMSVFSSTGNIPSNNCDSVVTAIKISFPSNNAQNTSPIYCYPLRFTVANAATSTIILKDSTINSGGFYSGFVFYQPTTSGTYIVTLTDAEGYQEQASIITTSTSPAKLYYATQLMATDCSQKTQQVMVGGNSFTKDGPYPVTFKLIEAPGVNDVSFYAPITISSYPSTNNWISLWSNLPVNGGNIKVVAQWSCPRNDTASFGGQQRLKYRSAKFDSAWFTIGSAGCSSGKANLNINLQVTDTLGNVTKLPYTNNISYPFLMRILANSTVNYLNGGGSQQIFTNLSPGTYKIGLAPNTPSYSTTPVVCPYWDTLTITIPNLGTPTIDANKTFGIICPGQSKGSITVVVNGYAPFKYAIRPQGSSSFGTQQPSNVFSNLDAGYYDVQVQDGCNNTTQQTVQVINAAANSILTTSGASTSGAVCAGGRVVFKAKPIGPTTSIVWTRPDGSTITNSDSLVVSNFDNTNSGIYTVAVTSAAGCVISESRMLSLAAPAGLVINNPSPLCNGSSIDLTSAAITSGSTNITPPLTYYTDAGATLPLTSPGNVTPVTTTTYYIKAISPDGCSVVKPVEVTVNPIPAAAAITSASTACATAFGSQVTLTATGGTTYHWYFKGTKLSPQTNSIPVTVTDVNAIGYYSVAVTDASGCEGEKDSAYVTINAPAGDVTTSGTQICSGMSAALTATAVNYSVPIYTWYSDAQLNNAVFTGPQFETDALTVNTNFYVTVSGKTKTGYTTCESLPANAATALVSIKPVPVTTLQKDTAFCNSVNVAGIPFESSVTGTTFQWTNSNTSIGLAASGTGNIPSFAAINSGSSPITATINVIPNASSCGGNAMSFVITIHPTPTVNAIADQQGCANSQGTNFTDPVQFNGSVIGTEFKWTMNNQVGYSQAGTDDIPAFAYTLPAGSSAVTSTVTVTPAANGCAGTARTFTYAANPYASISTNLNNAVQCLAGNAFVFDNTTTIAGNQALTYKWIFDDGTVTTSKDPSHSFTTYGDHSYRLIATSSAGCADSITAMVTVDPMPMPSFNYTITSLNTNDQYIFTSTSTVPSGNSGVNYYWEFGDGTNASTQKDTVSHLYAANGSYTVTLTVTSTGGCFKQTSQTIIVSNDPNVRADFSINNSEQCINSNSFHFTNTSQAENGSSITSYLWDFGDNITSTETSPVHSYSNPGTYTITLIATTNTGFKDTVTQSVNVFTVPDINKPVDQTICNNGNTAATFFTSNTGNPTYLWASSGSSIGLASSGSGSIATFTATNTGTTTATALITVTPVENGCPGTSQTFSIAVRPTAHVLSYTDQEVCEGKTTSAEIFSSDVAGASFAWTNDNSSIGLSAAGTNNINSFTAINTGDVQRIATIRVTPSIAGCSGVAQDLTIKIDPSAQLTSSLTPQGVCSGKTFSYAPTSTIAGTTYAWSRAAVAGITEVANAGIENINETLTNTTNAPLTVTYAFVLTTPSGCQSKDTIHVVVNPVPVVVLPLSVNVCNNTEVTIPAFGSNVMGTSYSWTNSIPSIGLAANGTGSLPLFNATNNTSRPEIATIQVTPFTAAPEGCVGPSGSFTITVNPVVTVHKLKDTTVCAGALITPPIFSSNTSGAGYTWTADQNIGLPLSGTGNLPAFTATTDPAGSFVTANITVVPSINSCAGTSMIYKISVNPVPIPDFSIDNISKCLNEGAFTFTDQSLPATGLHYVWDFGDGNSNIDQNKIQTHNYINAGTYNVKLTTNIAGTQCGSASVTKSVTVTEAPAAAFIYAVSSTNTNDTLQFASASSITNGTITGYLWNFGDGTTSTTSDPVHFYATEGNFIVTLTVTSDNGCNASAQQNVVITKSPNLVAGFTINDAAQCAQGNNFIFTNNSSINNGASIASYEWDFGDGTGKAYTADAAYVYTLPGTYIVQLIVTTTSGYSDIVTQSVTVYPVAAFLKPKDLIVCNGTTTPNIRFMSFTSGLSYSWTNDHPEIGLAANGNDPLISSFNAVNTTNLPITATIIVTPSANGCTGQPQTFTITVEPTPTVGGLADQVVCADEPTAAVAFTETVANTTFNWINDNTATGMAASGTGNIPSITATNAGITQQVSNIKVTPSASGCAGTEQTFSITVNPLPVITSALDAGSICSGSVFGYTPASSSTGTVAYQWSRVAVQGISNSAATGTGNPNEILTNTTSLPVTVTYLYSLTGNGCTNTTNYPVTVNVNATPLLSSSLTPPAVCNNGRFSYMPSSNTPNADFTWSRAADAYNSAATGNDNPYEILHNGGTAPLTVTYVYSLTANNCASGSQSVQVVVNSEPQVDFSSNTPQCLDGNSFAFTLSPNNGATSYSWNFGDANTGTGVTPSHSYTTDGTYAVTLTAASSAGCSKAVTHDVTVNPSPVAQFSYGVIAPNSNDNYQFTNHSIIGSGTITSYSWDFGDGNTSTTENPTHVYNSAGTYAVSLTVTSALGCSATTTRQLVVNKDPNIVAGFTINDPTQCISGNAFDLVDGTLTAAGMTITGYSWNFGDAATNNLQSPSHSYSSPGSYVITLHVTGTDGTNTFSDDVTQSIEVFATPDMQQPTDQTVCDQSTSSQIAFNPLQNGLAFSWTMDADIGAGTSGSGNIAPFIANNGNTTAKKATVIVTPSANGCAGIAKTFTIKVNPTPTVAGFADQEICVGNSTTSVDFTGVVANTSFTWINDNTSTGIAANGNGNIPSVTGLNAGASPNTSHIFVTPEANRCSGAEQSFSITIRPLPVMTSSGNAGTICTGNTFSYTPQSNIGNATFSWSRAAVQGISNNAATGTGNPNEILTNTTSLPVMVTYVYTLAVNGCDGASSYNVDVTVNPAPLLSSNITPPAICSGTIFNYQPLSATQGTSFAWNRASVAGISNTAASGTNDPGEILINTTDQPITVTYVYSLSANGCSNTQNVDVEVDPLPVPAFNVNNDQQCLKDNNFTFTNSSSTTSGSLTYAWDLDDGTLATSQDVTHQYTHEGNYTVKLVATSASGCVASVSKRVQVNPMPVANFTYGLIPPNSNDEYQFANSSVISSGVLSYLWNFGDAAISTDVSPTHIYTANGTYQVVLTTTSDHRCIDELTQSLIVFKDPNIRARFTINSAEQCLVGNSFEFTNTTTSSADPGTLSYHWDFGNGIDTSNETDPVFSYTIPGSYVVTLKVTGERNYVSVISQSVLLYPTPVVNKPLDQVVCNGLSIAPVNFEGGSPGIGYKWTNDHPEIGLATNGSGNIHSFQATNTSNAPIIANITVTPANNACSGIAQKFTITVNPTPGVADIADQTICNGQTTALIHFEGNVNGAMFHWLNNDTSIGLAEQGDGNIAPFNAINNGYTTNKAVIQVSPSANGCTGTTTSFAINVRPTPSLNTPLMTDAICDSAIFSYVPGSNVANTNFVWSRAVMPGISNGAATGIDDPKEMLDNITAVPVDVIYSYLLNADGCTNTQQVTVTVNPRPTLTSSIIPQTICDNTRFNYIPESSTAGTLFTWSRPEIAGIANIAVTGAGDPAEILNNTTSSPVMVNYLYLLSANGCYNTYNIGVRVDPDPALISGITAGEVCSGAPFEYAPVSNVAGTEFTWTRAAVTGISNGPATGKGNIEDTLINTTPAPVTVEYIYTINYDNCSAVQKVMVTVNPSPTLNTIPVDQIVCAGKNTTAIDLSGAVDQTVYNWTNSNTDIGLATNGTGTIPPFTTINSFEQPLPATIRINAITPAGCTLPVPAQFMITVDPIPSETITAPLGNILCEGASLPLVATGGDSYQWYENGRIINGATSSQYIVAKPGTYSVAASASSGCNIAPSGDLRINLTERPKADFTFDSYCLNTRVTFTNTSDTTNSGIVAFQWQDDAGHTSNAFSPVFTYGQAGTYTMKLVARPDACPSLADSISKPITIETPVAGVRLATVNTTPNAATALSARDIGNTDYLWQPSTGLNNDAIRNPIATLNATQQYLINMTMPSACVTIDTLLVQVLGKDLVYIPNVITPNGDGKNDKFVIVGLERYPGSEITIFNRWQMTVYQSHNYHNDWDAKGLLAGTYYYTLKLHAQDGIKTMNGWVTVLR